MTRGRVRSLVLAAGIAACAAPASQPAERTKAQLDWCAPVVVRPDQRLADPKACRFVFEPDEVARGADVVLMSGEGIASRNVRPPHEMTCWGAATYDAMANYVRKVNGLRPPGRPPIDWIAFQRFDLVYDTQAALPGFDTRFLARTSKPWGRVMEFFTRDASGACPAGGCRWSDAWGGHGECHGECLRDYLERAGPPGASERAVYYLNLRDHPTYWPSAALARLDNPDYRRWVVAESRHALADGGATLVNLNHKLWQWNPRESGGTLDVGGARNRDVASVRRNQDGWSAAPEGYGYPEYIKGWNALAQDLAKADVPFAVMLGRGAWDSPRYYDDPSTPAVDEAQLVRDVAERWATLVLVDVNGSRPNADRVAARLRALGRRALVMDSSCGYAESRR